MIGGTNKTLSFVSYVQVNISGTGDATNCYVIIDSNKYYSKKTVSASSGSTITFGVYSYFGIYGYVALNGTTIYTSSTQGTSTYKWTIPDNVSTINISLTYTNETSRSYIQITTT